MAVVPYIIVLICFPLPVKWIMYYSAAVQCQCHSMEEMHFSIPSAWTWPFDLFGP